MAATIDFANLGTLSPEDYAEQQALSKKQRLAQMLFTGSQNQPQGQMVSGHYVAPSFLQQLNPVMQALAGNYLEKTSNEEAMDYATRLRARDQEEMKTGLELWRGREGQAPNPQAAADFFMTAKGKQAQALGQKLLEQQFKEPEWKETTLELPNGTKVQGQYNKNASNPMATFVPFASSGNVEFAKAVHGGVAMPQIAGSGGTYGVGTMQPNPLNPAPMGAPAGNQNNFVNMAQSQGLPIISGVRDPAKQMGLVASQAPDGTFLTKEGRPVAVNSQHFHGNAVDLDPNKPISQAQQAWLNQYAIQGKGKDSNHYELKPEFRGQNMPQMPAMSEQKPDKYTLALPQSGFNSEQERQEWLKSARQPLTGESLNAVNGAMGTIRAADNYVNKLEKYDRKDLMANPNIRAEMQAATKNYLMFQKDAYKLGVLNKEDIPQLDAVVRDPSNIDNILVAKPALIKLAKFNQAFQRDNVIDAYQMSNKEIPSYVKNKLTAIDREEEKWAKAVETPQKENPNTVALKTQGQKVEPKAQDVSSIKSWLTANKMPYEPEKYSYGIENGQYYREKRK